MTAPLLIQVGEIRPNPHKRNYPDPHFFLELPPEGTLIFAPIEYVLPEHVATAKDQVQNPAAPPGFQVFSAVRNADSYGPCVHYRDVWENGTPLYTVASTKQEQVRALQELLDRYWDIAYQEGKEQRTQDTEAGDAQAVRGVLEQAFRQLAGR